MVVSCLLLRNLIYDDITIMTPLTHQIQHIHACINPHMCFSAAVVHWCCREKWHSAAVISWSSNLWLSLVQLVDQHFQPSCQQEDRIYVRWQQPTDRISTIWRGIEMHKRSR